MERAKIYHSCPDYPSVTFDFDAELRAALGPGYEIERELTGSGMSRVFVALERELNRRVVIKVLPPELAAGVNRERFRREIQLAAQLQHPHIVPLHAAGARGDLLYFTMPFIEGESLRHAIVEGRRQRGRHRRASGRRGRRAAAWASGPPSETA